MQTDFLSAKYWNERYIKGEFGWDVGYITTPIKEYIDSLPDKKIAILIPGCGNSYEAAYLIEQGFTNVTVIDIAETPINKLKKQFQNNQHLHIFQQDFFSFSGAFDLILEQTFFCALHPSLRLAYAKKMFALLKENGKLAGVLFSSQFEKEGPPFGGTKEEYEKLFSEHFKIKILEHCFNSIEPRKGNELFICLEKK